MLLLHVLLELVAAVLAVGAVRALVLRLAAALQRHVAHEVLARVVAALAVGAAVALVGLVLRARQGLLAAGQDVVARRLGRGAVLLGLLGRRAHVLEDGERRCERLLAHFFTPRHDTVSRRRRFFT